MLLLSSSNYQSQPTVNTIRQPENH